MFATILRWLLIILIEALKKEIGKYAVKWIEQAMNKVNTLMDKADTAFQRVKEISHGVKKDEVLPEEIEEGWRDGNSE